MGEGVKTLRSSFENLRARPELDEGTNGAVFGIIGDFSVLLSLSKYEPGRSIPMFVQNRTLR